jgi:integrase
MLRKLREQGYTGGRTILDVRDAAKRRSKRHKIVSISDPYALDMWVFPKLDGSIGHPHSFNSFLKHFCADNGIPTIGPHIFRHMHGSYLIKAGVDLAAVSAKLGHANKSFIANTYIHPLQSAEEHSAIVMQNILNDLKSHEQRK